jgi:FkbM family methyltransferase
MPDFMVDGMALSVPEALLGPKVRAALAEGRYEGRERKILPGLLRPGDRLLELGAGVGAVAIAASRLIGAEAVTAVEANPEAIPVLAANLARNGAGAVRIVHAAAVPDAEAGPAARFFLAPGFTAASLLPGAAPGGRETSVPTRGLHALVAEARATVLMMDVEGAEAALLARPLPAQVRAIGVETHPGLVPPAALDAIGAAMDATELRRRPELSQGDVWVFLRS